MLLRRHRPLEPVGLQDEAHATFEELRSHVPTNKRAARPGTAAVELAVLLPFLMAMFLGIVDMGRLFYASMTVDNSLHNSLLFASQTFDNQNQQWTGNNQYWQGPSSQIVATDTAAAQLDGANLNPTLTTSNITTTAGTDTDGNSVVVVTVTYTFQTLVPFPGVPSQVVITRTGQVRVAPAVPS